MSMEPKNPQRLGQFQLVLEGMAGEDRVALLDIDLHLVFQPVPLQEAVDRGDVVVVLVLGRLLRLRLDQDRALEADLVLVLDDEVEEAAELVVLALQVGVEQRLVALAAAPKDIVLAAELVVASMQVFTVAAAKANTSGSGLVAAPDM
jgi:hypothetical protein